MSRPFHAPTWPVKILPTALFIVVPVRMVSPEQGIPPLSMKSTLINSGSPAARTPGAEQTTAATMPSIPNRRLHAHRRDSGIGGWFTVMRGARFSDRSDGVMGFQGCLLEKEDAVGSKKSWSRIIPGVSGGKAQSPSRDVQWMHIQRNFRWIGMNTSGIAGSQSVEIAVKRIEVRQRDRSLVATVAGIRHLGKSGQFPHPAKEFPVSAAFATARVPGIRDAAACNPGHWRYAHQPGELSLRSRKSNTP